MITNYLNRAGSISAESGAMVWDTLDFAKFENGKMAIT